jgi:hypothetical protein
MNVAATRHGFTSVRGGAPPVRASAHSLIPKPGRRYQPSAGREKFDNRKMQAASKVAAQHFAQFAHVLAI